MKNVFLFLVLFYLLSGCSRRQECAEKVAESEDVAESMDYSGPLDSLVLKRYQYDTITFKPIDLNKMNLKILSLRLSYSIPDVKWAIFIIFRDSLKDSGSITFSIRELHNKKDSLLKKGIHLASGQINDAISNSLQRSGFSINSLTSDELEIYFDDLTVNVDYIKYAKGYIQIKKKIYWTWPKRISNGSKYIYPGDGDYLDYCIPVYYKPVKIYFEVTY